MGKRCLGTMTVVLMVIAMCACGSDAGEDAVDSGAADALPMSPDDPPAVEDLGGYLSVMYTRALLMGQEQVGADAGGRFYAYASGASYGTLVEMELDTCQYFSPEAASASSDLVFTPREAGDVKLVLDGVDVPLSPSTGDDGQPTYQNGGLVVGENHRFDAHYDVVTTGATVPALMLPAAIHTPADALPISPDITSGWTYPGEGDWPVSWSGSSDGEIRLTLMQMVDLSTSHQVLCRWRDDGEAVLPASVLTRLPSTSALFSYVTMERNHTLYWPMGDGTVLRASGGNIYMFDWNMGSRE